MSARPYDGRHVRPGRPRRAPYEPTFLPAHCAGTSCTHPHPGEPAWGMFPGLEVPVVPGPQCERTGAHGSHDTTEGRCPGVAGHQPPRNTIAHHAASVRAAIAGGSR